MDSDLGEMNLTLKFPNIDTDTIKYIYNVVCGGNATLAEDALAQLDTDKATHEVIKNNVLKKRVLTEKNKEDVSSFMEIAQVSRDIATRFLENNAWRLEDAVHMYYESGIPDSFKFPEKSSAHTSESIESLYNRLSKEDVDDIIPKGIHQNGLNKFAEELGIDPQTNCGILVIGWLIEAKTAPLTFTREEFVDGMDALGCESIADIQETLPQWHESLNNEKKLLDFIKFSFDFSTNSKILTPKVALNLWNSIYKDRNLPLFDPFIKFYEKSFEPVSKDTWLGVHHFLVEVTEVEDYDPDEGMYPLLIDQFMLQYNSNG